MRSLLLVALVTLPSVAHAEPTALFCVYPSAKPLVACFQHGSLKATTVDSCEARNQRRKQVPPRVRIDKGAWVEFSATTWRCVPAPVGTTFRWSIENHGALFGSEKLRVEPDSCASGRYDLKGPNLYGAMWAQCSRRKNTSRDEIVTP